MSLSVALAIHNEAATIQKCIENVYAFADEIIIVDGSSTDDTITILKQLDTQGKIHIFTEDNPAMFHINKQKAIERCKGDWILQLDADELVSQELIEEIRAIMAKNPIEKAFWIPRLNYFLGKPLRKGGQYPDYTIRLYRNGAVRFPCITVHEQVELVDKTNEVQAIGKLTKNLLHFPYPSFSNYIYKWIRYSELESELLKKQGIKPGLWLFIKYFFILPKLWFLKTYFRHKGFQDGFPGFVFSLFSSLRYWLIYIRLWELSTEHHEG